jgi:hypothetical protein
MRYQAEPGNEGIESNDLLEGARQSLWKCVPRQSRGTRGTRGTRGNSEAEPLEMRSQAEPGNEGMRGNSEAEPLEMRSQAEPGNEEYSNNSYITSIFLFSYCCTYFGSDRC